MAPETRQKMEGIYNKLLNEAPEAKAGIEIVKLALDMDDKGEYWKFKEVFGTSEPNGSYEASEV